MEVIHRARPPDEMVEVLQHVLAMFMGARRYSRVQMFDLGDTSDAASRHFAEFLEESFNSGTSGPPPAPQAAIDTLLTEKVSHPNGQTCSICQENYVVDDVTSGLPCKHSYHTNCIVQW
jgi:hypothetical protein